MYGMIKEIVAAGFSAVQLPDLRGVNEYKKGDLSTNNVWSGLGSIYFAKSLSMS